MLAPDVSVDVTVRVYWAAGVAGGTPLPLRSTVCGLPAALSVMLTDAVRVPVVVGENVTLIWQLAPAEIELPQLLVWAKSPLLPPVSEIPVTLNAALPELVSVNAFAALVLLIFWELNARFDTDRLTPGAGGGEGAAPPPPPPHATQTETTSIAAPSTAASPHAGTGLGLALLYRRSGLGPL